LDNWTRQRCERLHLIGENPKDAVKTSQLEHTENRIARGNQYKVTVTMQLAERRNHRTQPTRIDEFNRRQIERETMMSALDQRGHALFERRRRTGVEPGLKDRGNQRVAVDSFLQFHNRYFHRRHRNSRAFLQIGAGQLDFPTIIAVQVRTPQRYLEPPQ
jgi:hypothetical protein